jgi:phenylacetate-coenzyme A ligase PaaK-like adenylate-forming protein
MTATTVADRQRAARHARLRAARPDHLERLTWSAERIRAHQRDRLRALLRHAKAGSPFHAERLAGVDPARFELDDLPSLPTMTKAEMMANLDRLLTDPRLSRAALERHLAQSTTEATELLGEYVVLASGGSSGERGVFAYGADAIVDYTLGLIRAGLGRLLALGSPPPGGVPMAVVAAAAPIHATRALPDLFSGDLLAITSVPVTLPLPEIVARLNRAQPVLLQGYPSVLSLLAAERAAGRLQVTPMAVTSSSEQLPPDARARVAAAFGVPVVDQFGSTEGVLGASAPDDAAIVLAGDLAIVELVDERDRPVPPGTPSAKALVTNLMNPTQPLIRYELPDRFVRQPDAAEHGHLRVTVEGRADELLGFGDVVVHPLVLRSVLVEAPEVVEYQVTQTRRGVHVGVVAPGGVDAPALAARLAAALGGAGVHGAEVTVEPVPAIARHPDTGKARRFVTLPGGAR